MGPLARTPASAGLSVPRRANSVSIHRLSSTDPVRTGQQCSCAIEADERLPARLPPRFGSSAWERSGECCGELLSADVQVGASWAWTVAVYDPSGASLRGAQAVQHRHLRPQVDSLVFDTDVWPPARTRAWGPDACYRFIRNGCVIATGSAGPLVRSSVGVSSNEMSEPRQVGLTCRRRVADGRRSRAGRLTRHTAQRCPCRVIGADGGRCSTEATQCRQEQL